MISRHCSTCDAPATAEYPLEACGACKKVAYCSKKCQKAHWIVHKPVCRATITRVSQPSASEHVLEGESIKDEDGNRVLDGMTYPVGTYIEWFEMPTTASPDGSTNTIHFTKPMVVWLASLSDDESEVFEMQIVEGCKSGPVPLEIFQQAAQEEGFTVADQERANDLNAYKEALPILAARYEALRTKEVDISKRDGTKFVRINEEGDVVLLDVINEEFVASADAILVLETEGDEERTALVFFDSDDIANMKHLRIDEKKMYRKTMARVIMEHRYPGTTVVPASETNATTETEAEVEGTAAEQDSLEDDPASMNLGQQ